METEKTSEERPNWPSIDLIQRLHRGMGLVIPVPGTDSVILRGLRSVNTSIVYSGDGTAFCFNCNQAQRHPGPPKGIAGPGSPATPLFSPDTRAFAVFTLTWLNRFYNEHKECKENGESS